MTKLRTRGAVTTAAVLAVAGAASGDILDFTLADHPNGRDQHGAYALRFDNLFTTRGGEGGVTVFAMDRFDDATLTVSENGRITISATVYGGVLNDGGLGFGEGSYELMFTYAENVTPVSAGFVVGPASEANGGMLRALGDNNGVGEGTQFVFGDLANEEGLSFEFLRDGFRLEDSQRAALNDPWVGRGLLTAPNVIDGIADFVFIGSAVGGASSIPLPGAAGMAGAGIALLAVRRRRR